MHSVIEAIVKAQPPVWGVGMMVAQKFIAAMIRSDKTPVKALGSVLLSFTALLKVEGYTAAVIDMQALLLQVLDENKDADPAALLEILRSGIEREHLKILETAPQTYATTFGAMVKQAGSIPIDPQSLDAIAEHLDAFTGSLLEETET